jgi:hypothetical protein
MPDGSPGPRPTSLSNREIHENFGQRYRLQETRQQYLPQSLFFHDVVSHSKYDDYKFEPKFEITQQDLEDTPEVDRICSDSQSCIYDYIVTKDSGYAEQTKKTEATAQIMYQEISQKVFTANIFKV